MGIKRLHKENVKREQNTLEKDCMEKNVSGKELKKVGLHQITFVPLDPYTHPQRVEKCVCARASVCKYIFFLYLQRIPTDQNDFPSHCYLLKNHSPL